MPRRLHSSVAALVAAVFLLLALCPAAALAVEGEPAITEAKEAIVVGPNGEVLWERNSKERMALASITKVMTAIVALDSDIPLDQVCELVEVDLPGDAQTALIKNGEKWTFRELLEVTLVFSANDAAVNVGIAVAGSEQAFVDLMNKKAAEIGMADTHFMNPHGLEDPEHYSTASDIVLMGRYALENYPEIARMVHMVNAHVDRPDDLDVSEDFPTTDRLVKEYEGALGIKTGSTESGATFLGAARRVGTTLYTCVLGCETSDGRWNDTYALLDWAYEQYGEHMLANSKLSVRHPHFAFRFGQRLRVTCERDLVCGIWPDEGYSYSRIMTQPNVLCTPGMPYAGATFSQGERLLGSRVWSCGDELVQLPSFGPLNTALMTGEATLPEPIPEPIAEAA